MLMVVAVYSVLLVLLGGYGLVFPSGALASVRRFVAASGIWPAFVIRLVFAIALWFGAPSSATPLAFHVLAAVAFLAAVALPMIGAARFGRLVQWWSQRPSWAVRLWLLPSVALGLFTLWSSVAG